MTRQLLLLVLLAALGGTLTACDSGASGERAANGYNDPPGDVPAAFVGGWFEGTLSTIQFYSPTTGEWAPTNGTGSFLLFGEDGTYREGGIMNVTTYGCTSQLYVELHGTAVVDGNTLTLRQRGGRSRGSICSGEVHERTLEAETNTYTWHLSTDSGGYERLTLTTADGQPYASYRAWN